MSDIGILERTELWKYVYACESFRYAKKYCDALVAGGYDNDHVLRLALSVAISVTYCRPFKQRPLVQIPKDLVPSDYLETHDVAIDIRDKCIAHKDREGSEAIPEFSNDVTLTFEQGAVSLGTVTYFVTDDLAQRLSDLCAILIDKCEYHADKHLKRSTKCFPQLDGKYILNLSSTEDRWIKRID